MDANEGIDIIACIEDDHGDGDFGEMKLMNEPVPRLAG